VAHLQAEVHRRLARRHRSVASDRQRQRGLAHGGTSAQHDECAGLEAIELGIEVGEAGRRAGDRAGLLVHLLEAVERVAEQVAQGHQRVGHPALGHLVDQRLGPVHRLRHVVGRLEAQLGDLRGGGDQAPQQGVLLHHLGVVGGVGDGGGRALQLDDRADPSDAVQQRVAGQLVGDQHRVDRRPSRIQAGDGVEHVAVRWLVKVGRVQALQCVADRRRAEQHGTQQGPFGRQVVGGLAPTAPGGGSGALRPVSGSSVRVVRSGRGHRSIMVPPTDNERSPQGRLGCPHHLWTRQPDHLPKSWVDDRVDHSCGCRVDRPVGAHPPPAAAGQAETTSTLTGNDTSLCGCNVTVWLPSERRCWSSRWMTLRSTS